MAETYCGKTCGSCPQRETMNCPGCKAGPGAVWPGECELAKCCRDKGHETCGTCTQQKVCGMWSRREEMPARRRERREFEARKLADQEARKRALAETTASLIWRLKVLFWLVVPGTIAGFLSDEALSAHWPDLASLGEILGILCSVVYGLLLLSLARVNGGYRAAGACTLFVAVAGIIIQSLGGGDPRNVERGIALILTLLAGVAALVGEYTECTSHAEALEPVDLELSGKWRRLWKWYIGTYLGSVGSIVVVMIFGPLGLLVMLASIIGMMVVAILKLVYLWRTARTFREYEEMEA